MTRRSSGRDSLVIVVGDPEQDFVREMVRVTRECGLEPARCDDVYAAVVTTAGGGDRPTLVLGRMSDLSRENGRFFPLAAANGVRCCCLLDPSPAARQGPVCAALQAGTLVVAAVGEVRALLQDWLAEGRRPNPHALPQDDLHATEAELSALLGQQANA